jgi:lipooligosaccharide transport system permease protein
VTEQAVVAQPSAPAAVAPLNTPWPMRCLWVAQRNCLVWRKLIVVALVGHLAEPIVWLACLGLGVGSLLPPIDGMPYVQYLCIGMVCSSAMNSASSEGLYGAFSRWQFRRTWEAILSAPMTPRDIVVGEWLWAAVKGAISGIVIMALMIAFDLLPLRAVVPMVLLTLLIGLAFAGIGLFVAGVAQREELHTYYFSLVLLPLTAISGVFFPMDRLPEALRILAEMLPLSHAVSLGRDLASARPVQDLILHVAVLLAYACTSIVTAVYLINKRLMR